MNRLDAMLILGGYWQSQSRAGVRWQGGVILVDPVIDRHIPGGGTIPRMPAMAVTFITTFTTLTAAP